MYELWKTHRICAILRNIPDEQLPFYADAAFSGGIRLFEVAMNTKNGMKQIEILRKQFGEEAHVGAGTVITADRCHDAWDGGAQFFLTPSVNREVMKFCAKRGIPVFPGVMTPTDVSVCLEYGCFVMKLFPAGDLPDTYIKSLKGPFDGTEYIAVGGVKPENAAEFIRRGFIGAGIGSNLISEELIKNGEWKQAEEQIRHMMGEIKNMPVRRAGLPGNVLLQGSGQRGAGDTGVP